MIRWLLPLLIVLIGVAGFLALKASKPAVVAIDKEEKSWVVETQPVVIETLEPTLTLYGSVESPRLSKLSASVSADIQAVHVLEGEVVKQGDVLIELDNHSARLTLVQRNAEVAEIRSQIKAERNRDAFNRAALVQEQRMVELNRRSVKRALDLASTNVGSQSQLDEAQQNEAIQVLALDNRKLLLRDFSNQIEQLEAKLNRALAQRDLAQRDLDRATVVAPFTGRVAEVLVSPGERVRVGDPLLRIYDTSAIEIRSQIPMRHLPTVRSALRSEDTLVGRMRVDGLNLNLRLSRLSGEVTQGSGGLEALFSVQDNGDWLQLGRTVELVVTLPKMPNVVALPREAIYGTNRIFKLDGERMVGVTVERLGEYRDSNAITQVLIDSGTLSDGELVITTQLPNAIDGLKVRTESRG